jgi:hypothetical protein
MRPVALKNVFFFLQPYVISPDLTDTRHRTTSHVRLTVQLITICQYNAPTLGLYTDIS